MSIESFDQQPPAVGDDGLYGDAGQEPTPMRDNGPYASIGQVRQQVSNVIFGMPPGLDLPAMLIREALMIAGVDLSEFEEEFAQQAGLMMTAEQAQVIAGWLIRSHLAGREQARR